MPNLRQGMMGAAGVSTGAAEYKLYMWGNNLNGVLGFGDVVNRSSPVQLGSLENWTQVSVGSYNSSGIAAVNGDGELFTWGRNTLGVLGQGEHPASWSSPIQVGSLTDWLAGAMNNYSCLGFKTDGTLWAWGKGTNGQLGNGFTSNKYSPIQIGSLTDWGTSTWVNAWGSEAGWVVIKPDGTLWSWGDGTAGQLMLEDEGVNRSSPTQVGSDTDWYRGIQAGSRGSVMVKTDGTLWGGGQNTSGELGLGDAVNRSSPVQIGSLTNWKNTAFNIRISASVSAGGGGVRAVKDDGTLWSWGSGYAGRLGLGNTTTYSSPVQIGGLTNWYRQKSSYTGGGVINTSGELFMWGKNNKGQLGLEDEDYRSSPVQLGTDTNWGYLFRSKGVCAALKT